MHPHLVTLSVTIDKDTQYKRTSHIVHEHQDGDSDHTHNTPIKMGEVDHAEFMGEVVVFPQDEDDDFPVDANTLRGN